MQPSILVHAGAGEAPEPFAREMRGYAAPPVRLLGARRLGGGMREAMLQYRKGWALLAYLAMERQRHPRARLAAMFWPDLGETAALTNLRQVLSDLNRAVGTAVGEGVLLIDRESVRLCPVASAGLFDIDRLDEVVDEPGEVPAGLATTGELLDGLALDACPAFSDWLACARERVARRLVDGLVALREAAAASGDRRQALLLARRLVVQDPWNEAHCRALMRLHVQAGEPGMALACFRSLAHRLEIDLGETPSRETCELVAAIRVASRRQAASWTGARERPFGDLMLALGA
jgi:DNA-binding SARP family transcriptional activator